MDYIISIIKRTLLKYDIAYDTKRVTEILLSDNAYPSALAIIRTLYYYGIKSEAYKSDFESLKREETAMIVHCTLDEGHFYFVENITNSNIKLYDGETHLMEIDSFLNLWDGIVIVIGDNKSIKTSRKTSNKSMSKKIMLVFLLILSISLCKDVPTLFQMLINYVGLFISIILFYKNLFPNTDIPLCHIGKYINCNAVSKYNPLGVKIPFGLSLVGTMFFIFDIFAILLGISSIILFIAYILGTLCSIYLLGYQIFHIRKYCLYCLMVGLCIITKIVLLALSCKITSIWTITMLVESLFCFIFATIMTCIIYKSINYKREKEESIINALSLKRTPQLFWERTSSVKEVEMPKQPSLSFGMGKMITIDTIIELGCQHCQNAINILVPILEQYIDFVTWNIYIFEPASDADEKNSTALELMELYKRQKGNFFFYLKKHKFHYDSIDISEETILENENIQKYLQSISIKYFPYIAINSRPFPPKFNIKDLDILISDWKFCSEK